MSFILFDIRVGKWWLTIEDINDIGKKLGIDVVPVVGRGSLLDAVDRIKSGITSTFGDFLAEGIVLCPSVPLFNRAGNRIITKLKHCDFGINKEKTNEQ